jgi:hypothetical protein
VDLVEAGRDDGETVVPGSHRQTAVIAEEDRRRR